MYVVGEVVGVENTLLVRAAMMINMDIGHDGKMNVRMFPLCPFAKDDVVSFSPAAIAYDFQPSDELVDHYTRIIRKKETGIELPPEKKLLLS